MVESLVKIGRVSSEPQETLDINSIALIDENLYQNMKIYKQNDSNNCSFDDTDINAEMERVNETILCCEDEPDKLAKQRKNREILSERLRLISRKEWLISNPIPTISLEEEILQLLAEEEFDSVSQIQEEIAIVQQRILDSGNKPIKLKNAQIKLEKYNIILQKHAQLVQPKIKEILDELELLTIDEAIQLQKDEIKKLEKLSLTKLSARQKCQKNIDLVNKIIELDGRKIVQLKPDPNQNPIPQPIAEPIPEPIPKAIPEPMPIPESVLQIESLFQREKEDAASQAEFIKCAPDSFEKSVIIITHILYQIQDVEVELSAHDKYLDIPTSSYQSMIQAHITNLKQTYIGDVIKNTKIIDKLNQLEEPNGHNYQKILKTLKEIKPLVSIFSFQEFFSYYEKACQVSQTIKNTEIILLLGTTGAGKSTSIHYLCGSKMYETEKDGLKHIAFGEVTNEDLKNVKVSPFSRSETRYIRPIKIDLPMQDSMTLVDSPGLFDLKNAEVDVSNQLGIIKALSCVKSVKPFIVFSYKKLGAKGEDFKQILNFYSQMIKDSDYFDSFNFFFSHVANEFTMKNLTAKIKDIKQQLNEKEKQTVRLVEFLNVLIEKAENDEIYIINPLNSSKVSELLKTISRQKKKINPRSGVFQKVICDESKQKIVDQFELHQNQIYNQFNKAGAEKVGHLLSELKKFCEIMDSDHDYKLKYNAIIKTLSLQLNKKYEEVSLEFKKQFQSTNRIGEEEVGLFQSNLLFMYTLEQVRKDYLSQIDGDQIHTHSHQELEIQVAKIIKDTYQQINQPKAAKLDSNILHAYLQNLDFLSNQKIDLFFQIRNEIVEKLKISLIALPEVAGKLMYEGIDLFEKQSVDISNSNEKAKSFEQKSPKVVEEVKHNELRIEQNGEQTASQLIDEFSNLMGELERAELCFKGELKTLLLKQKDQIIQNLLKVFEASYFNIFGDSQNMIAHNITNLSNISDLELNSMIVIQMSKDKKIQKISKYYQLLQSFIKSMNKQRLSQGLIDQIEGKKSKLNDQIISWSTVQEEKLKRKVSQEKRYSEIQLIYNELMLAQNLPVLQGQTIRQNRIKMHLSKLVKDKSNEAQKYMSQIEKIVDKQAEEGQSKDNQQISMYTLVSLRDAISTIKNLGWTIENGNEEIYEDLVQDLEKNLHKLIKLIEQSVRIRRENKSGISEIGETEQAFKQINEIQNIAELINIKLPEMKIDEYIPEIEHNLNGAEIFLIRKRIISAEDSKIDQSTFDELLKKSECEKFSKYYHYFKILQKRTLMITKIDQQSKIDQSQKNYATRISEMNAHLQTFVESQMEKIVQELKYTQINKMKEYSTLIQSLKPNEEGLYENDENDKASIYLTENLTYPVERVLSIFKMMKELKTKYDFIWKQINPNDDEEELKEVYVRFYNKINTNIALSINNQVEVINNLKIMNQLIPLDQFIHDSNDTGQNLVQAQYDAHFKNIINFQINVVRSVEDCIRDLNYEEIKSTLDTIQRLDGIDQQINLRRIKSLLNSRCNALCYSINKDSRYLLKGRQLDPSTIEKINKESSELQDIIKIIGERILDKIVYDKAKLILDNVQTKLELDLKQLKTLIYSLIQNQRYKEANDYIENYFESAKQFNNFNNQIEETNHIEQIQELRTILQDSIKSKMKEFEDLKISSDQNLNDDTFLEKIINNSPKEIIQNLESNPSFILSAQNIKQSIEDTFSQRIGQLSLSENSIVSKITIYLKYCLKLPQDLQLKFERELKELQTKFEGLQEKACSTILENIQKWKNDELSNLKRVFDELVEIKYSLNNKCRSEINKLYYEESVKTLKSIKEKGLTFEIQNKLYQLWLYQSSDQIKNSLDNFSNGEYLKIIRTIQNIFESIEKRIIAMLFNRENSQENSIRIEEKDYSFDIGQLIWYNQIFENQEFQNLVNEIFSDFQERVFLNLVKQAEAQIQRLNQDFCTIIKNDDPGNLQEIFQLIIAMRSIKPAQELLVKLSLPKYKREMEEFVKFSKVNNKDQFCNQFKETFNKIANQIKEAQLINSESNKNDGERKLYYEKIDKQFSFIQKSQLVHEDLQEIQIDTKLIQQECENNFVENYTQIEQEVQELIEDFQIIDQKKNQRLNINLENLKIIQEKFKSLVPKNFEQLKKRAIDVIQKKADTIKDQLNNQIFQSKAITDILILLQNIALNVKQLQESAQEQIQLILDCLQQNSQDQKNITEIALILKKSPVGSLIVDQQSIFISEARQFWAKKIQYQEIEYVLENLLTNENSNLTTQEKDDLKIQYDQFQEAYTNLVEKNIVPYEDIPQNKEQIKTNLLELTQMSNKEKEKFGKTQKDEIYLLLAHLFALWTLSDFYKNKLKLSDSQDLSSAQFILRPHPAQVVSIFRILGHGYQDIVQQDEDKLDIIKKQQMQQFLKKNNLLFDNLVQIKTGEGKSITLAIVIAVFAMWDFEVSCACYSEYLSNRDFKQFEHLYDFLNIKDKIQYGTFNKICENYINKDGKIRDIVLNTILKESQIEINTKPQFKRRVILIDEVDVFFGKEFYNKVYVPIAEIKKNQKVSNLLDFVWASRGNPSFSFKKFKKTQQYLECAAIFKDEFVGILDEACKKMMYAAQNYQNHQYVVQNEKIGYQEMDQISFSQSYGYNTIFAYYHHAQTGEISQSKLEECKAIEIYCGKFSYSEFPLYSMFILGVTGTLDSLTEMENQIIRNFFQIQNFTFSPSVYGKNKLQWENLDPDQRLLIYNQSEYYIELTNQIYRKMKGDNCQRAVIVFFKTLQLLKEYRNSTQYQELTCDKQELTELCDEQDKEGVIIKATYQNTLTLTTRSYGRGTDFICRDETVERNGGVHVILTFVPEMHSEFVQIQGRTARQGNNGSFQMILLDYDLQEVDVDVTSDEFKQQYNKKLEYIFRQRDLKVLKEQKSNTDAVKEIKKKHLDALEFKDLLLQNDSCNYPKLSQYLVSINEGVIIEEDENPVKTMILMDATGSMSSFLTEAKNSVNQMFERSAKILEQNDLAAHLNWLQYACYRNYSSGPKMILQHSPWESKPDQLKLFMDQISTSGGQGNEAVEIGFQHAVREALKDTKIPLRQIYLIGDMPPNTQNEVDSKRGSSLKWQGTQFDEPAYWESELAKLSGMNIIVNTFYIRDSAKSIFQEIAQRTGGTCTYLDVNQPNSQQILLDLFLPNILQLIGDATGDTTLGEQMVDDYMRCYRNNE